MSNIAYLLLQSEWNFPVHALLLCSLVGCLATTLWKKYNLKAKYRLPAVVPGWALIGNSFQMPATGQGPFIRDLTDKYGEM